MKKTVIFLLINYILIASNWAELDLNDNILQMTKHHLLYSIDLGDDAEFLPNEVVPISFIAMVYLDQHDKYAFIPDKEVLFEIYKNQELLKTVTPVNVEKEINGIKANDFFEAAYTPKSLGNYTIVVTIEGTDHKGDHIKEKLYSGFKVYPAFPKISTEPIASVVDTNNNGLMDELILTFPYEGEIPEKGKMSIFAELQLPTGEILQSGKYITQKDNQIFVKFSGEEIGKNKGDASLVLKKFRVSYDYKELATLESDYELSSYPNDIWERDKILYLDNFTHRPIDINKDSIYDQLEISFDIDSLVSGDYILTGSSKRVDNFTRSAISITESINIHPGVNSIKILIDGASLKRVEDRSLDVSGIMMYHDHKNKDATLYIKEIPLIDQYDFSTFSNYKIVRKPFKVKYNHTGSDDG